MEHKIKYIGICMRGLVRRKNEDNLWCGRSCLPLEHPEEEYDFEGTVGENNCRFAVFDGIGGEACGEAASYEAACAFGEAADDADVQALCAVMNSRVLAYAEEHHAYGMGTTVAGLFFGPEKVQGFNVGDSRCYVFSDGKLTQLSVDHTYRSFVTGKSLLTQCIGVPETEFIPEPDLFTEDYRKGDLFLLCSDGLWNMLGDDLIEEILNAKASLKERAESMKKEVLACGAIDNMTLLLFEVL